MELMQLIVAGRTKVVDMWKRGELTPGQAWYAVAGAWRYVVAMAGGDVATLVESRQRVSACDGCVERHEVQTMDPRLRARYCGEHLGKGHEGPVCGCLVGISVDGAPYAPAGKARVGSERCPQGKWPRQVDVRGA